MKRFYKTVAAVPADGGFAVQLDGRTVKTPGRAALVLPSEGLAAAIAGEWDAQSETLVIDAMPLTRLANTAIDRVAANPGFVTDELAGFAASDLLCYWAEEPAELQERQARAWMPVLRWAEERHGAALVVAHGIIHREQPGQALRALKAAVQALDPFALSALHTLATGSGSLLLGLAVVDGQIGADEAFTLSQIDEAFQTERWGEDEEAQSRRAALAGEMIAAGRFLELCQAND